MKPLTAKPSDSMQARVGLQAFFKIIKKWQLSPEQARILLGDIPKATFYRWKKTPPQELSADTLDRISYILGIYKALHILLPNEQAANQWIHQANQAYLFSGHTALDKLLCGKLIDLAEVRRYLDAERGW